MPDEAAVLVETFVPRVLMKTARLEPTSKDHRMRPNRALRRKTVSTPLPLAT